MFVLDLPEDDRSLSPHTGYTRAHWEPAADGLLRAALRFATPHHALLDLPGPPSQSGVRSDGLEGFARTFLLAALRGAGAYGKDPHGFLERYTEGIDHGTRTPGRDDAESWPLIGHHGVQGQPMVESASIALGLRLTAPWTWDALTPDARDRTEEWLRGALRHAPAPNNWYLFQLTVAGFLESVGRGDAETARAIDRPLGLLDGWYQGQGWYSDGDGRAFDHYNGWALHMYPLLHAHLAGDRALSDRLGPRLEEFLDGFALLFDANGAPIHHGRSLTYRFAAGAAVALGALTGHTPLAPGTTRRLLSGALRHFLDRGALSADGILGLGWYGPHAPTVQRYSGPASPYWASKGFLGLLLPAEHPVWTAPEEAARPKGPTGRSHCPPPGCSSRPPRATAWCGCTTTAAARCAPGRRSGHPPNPSTGGSPTPPAPVPPAPTTSPTITSPSSCAVCAATGCASSRSPRAPAGWPPPTPRSSRPAAPSCPRRAWTA
ncbi:conserved hypothetical protein [Streptomyces himastatinicus ATCC 53653]|uniref:DUF2264 domain-containing protein n=1 Tax=Streptomyces himastatinicus ATCC 53653 TaxID=457427 RepID=D9WDU6_9ACTN|nr:conserved hypothetical protein [Streptomyces himastatinicus ATCC 53653]